MENIGFENWSSGGQDYIIVFYRENNYDRIKIEAYESIKGFSGSKAIAVQYVPMNGDWDLERIQYSEFSTKLAAVKAAIIVYCSAAKIDQNIEADIFKEKDND